MNEMPDSNDTVEAKVALRKALKTALFSDMKTAVLIQEAIDNLIECKIIDAINLIADRTKEMKK